MDLLRSTRSYRCGREETGSITAWHDFGAGGVAPVGDLAALLQPLDVRWHGYSSCALNFERVLPPALVA